MRQIGKQFSSIKELKDRIEEGLNCVVATGNPEKYKSDFKYVTGLNLILEIIEGSVNMFNAKIN